MSLKSFMEWLRKTAPPEDPAARAERFTRNLDSQDITKRNYSEWLISRVVHYWKIDYDADVVIEVLKVVERKGSERVLPLIELLAAQRAHSEPEKRVQAAAQACLFVLSERIEREQTNASLPRPASAPSSAVDDLLRPAAGVAISEPQHLLHSVQAEPPPGKAD